MAGIVKTCPVCGEKAYDEEPLTCSCRVKRRVKTKDYESIAKQLATCVVFALEYLKATGGGVRIDMKTMTCRAWQHDFLDALDAYGVKVDREAYFQQKGK